MADNQLTITYKVYLEAEDVSQSRIRTSISFVENIFKNCSNQYLHNIQVDNESDYEDYTLRLYIEHEVVESECTSPENANTFLEDMAEILDVIAQANSYLDMEGSFLLEYKGEKKSYNFTSESGQGLCDFKEA